MPLLVTYCQGCHGNNGKFSVTTPALTYDNIAANNFVDTVNVDLSPLLTKASGNNHGGGTILPVNGSVYLSLRNWIAQGADGNTTGGTTTGGSNGGAVSFSASVMPVVTSNCKACHGSSGNFSVTTTGATYSNITGNGFVNTSAADASLLLTKASGTNHGGGTILPSSGVSYQLLRDWINQGALNN
jgi:mono/diheme cytochrome c family protein